MSDALFGRIDGRVRDLGGNFFVCDEPCSVWKFRVILLFRSFVMGFCRFVVDVPEIPRTSG